MCAPVQVLQEIRLWAIGKTKYLAQQRQQVNSLKPDVTVTWLQTQSERDTAGRLSAAAQNSRSRQPERPLYLQSCIDLILDVFNDVAFYSWVAASPEHVSETGNRNEFKRRWQENIHAVSVGGLRSLLEKSVLGFSVELVDAELEHLQSFSPLQPNGKNKSQQVIFSHKLWRSSKLNPNWNWSSKLNPK